MRTSRRLLLMAATVATFAAACAPAPSYGTPAASTAPQSAVRWPHTADPYVLVDGATSWVFASDNGRRMPVRGVTDLDRVYSPAAWEAGLVEGMPQRPAWAADDTFWAPTVARFGDTYVAFFAANRIDPPDPRNRQCIGRATAASPDGPYVADPTPFSCGLDGSRGALDPSLFAAPNGQVWLYAAFADTESPIWMMRIGPTTGNALSRRPDGQAAYWPFAVATKQFPWQGRFIENPSMTYDRSTDTYLLAYSAGDWWTAGYSTGLARCSTPFGGCTHTAAGPWLSASAERTGPGGLEFLTGPDGGRRVVYSSYTPGTEGMGSERSASVAPVSVGWSPAIG
jgi:hypothetical protein